jgi:DNA polymerase-1
MEAAGIGIDGARWRRVKDMYAAEVAELEKGLRKELGVQNLDHNDEILVALQRQGLPVEETNSEALAPYMHLPFVQHLVRYRRLNGFVTGAGKAVLTALESSTDGRVHPNINQIGSTTGRMSADHPNMMGLPKDPIIRSCVIPAPGNKLVVGDYNAIELRVAAQVTGDPVLQYIFKIGGDPHRYMASVLTGTPEVAITAEQRTRAKPINFGLLLGMGAASLVTYAKKNFGVDYTLPEAARFKQVFLQTFPGIAAWQNTMARERWGVLRNQSGRACCSFDPDEGYNARLAFPIQGTAADGLKTAMVLLAPQLAPLGARLILAVHDELVVEAPDASAEAAKKLVRDCMVAGMATYITAVPIVVEPEVRATWAK